MVRNGFRGVWGCDYIGLIANGKDFSFYSGVTGNLEGGEQKSDIILHFSIGCYLKKRLLGSSCGRRQTNWNDFALVYIRNYSGLN